MLKESNNRENVSCFFVSLNESHLRKMHPGESLSLFVHELKKLLNQAMPTLEKMPMQLLLHQFLAGISDSVSFRTRATGDITTLEKAVEKARLLRTTLQQLVSLKTIRCNS